MSDKEDRREQPRPKREADGRRKETIRESDKKFGERSARPIKPNLIAKPDEDTDE